MIPLTIVAAVADNGVIGRDNGLIWRLKSDLRRFRAITLGKPMIMGRKTFDSIGRPLPGRETVVLTRSPGFPADGVRVARSWEEAVALGEEIAAARGLGEVIVAGGAEVYRLALPRARLLRLTLVHAAPEGDALFPDYEPSAYRTLARESHGAGPDDEHPFTFVDLERRGDAASR